MALRTQEVVEIHGYALRALREVRGQQVSDFAKELNVSRSYIAHLENGTKRNVSRPFYNAILRHFGVTDFRALLAVAPAKGEVFDPVPIEPPIEAESA